LHPRNESEGSKLVRVHLKVGVVIHIFALAHALNPQEVQLKVEELYHESENTLTL